MKPKWDEQKVMIVKWSRSLDQDGPLCYKMFKTLKISCSKTTQPIALELDMQHKGL